MKQNPITVKTPDGSYEMAIPTQVQRLALTSTMQMLMEFDQKTAEIQEQVNQLRRQLETRMSGRNVMEGQLMEAWATTCADVGIPVQVDPRTVKWMPDGSIQYQKPEGLEEPPAEDQGGEGKAEDEPDESTETSPHQKPHLARDPD